MFVGLVMSALPVRHFPVVVKASLHEKNGRIHHRIPEPGGLRRFAVPEKSEQRQACHSHSVVVAEMTFFRMLLRRQELQAVAHRGLGTVESPTFTKTLHSL